MEEAQAVRRAAREAVRDVVPADFRAVIEGHVTDGSAVPGVFTVLAARGADPEGDAPDGVTDRAAGVQLIYDGLRITRDLARAEPWVSGDAPDASEAPAGANAAAAVDVADASDAADLDVLAADVLVARGFYLLARTEAAATAVEVVRAFGRDQTDRESASDPAAVDRRLEGDVLELAAVAGSTAAGGRAGASLRTFAGDLAEETEGRFPEPERLFTDATRGRLARLADGVESAAPNRND